MAQARCRNSEAAASYSAYSFTDYRSQGQTISHTIIDIGTPPTGGLTPFNVYVALSRSRGQDNFETLMRSC
jgi:ATP-dependent exoDNAse (exonuclease V) alpha subunit